MKVIIIEDEKLSADNLKLLLNRIDNSIQVLKYLDSVKATVKAFQEGLKADLIFMDIHLADGNSFEIFKQIGLETPIIFTTAFDSYALQAFKQNSIDYLLKPISQIDLSFAIEKFKKQQTNNNQQLLEKFSNVYQEFNRQYKSRFMVKIGKSIETIQTSDCHHFESQDGLTFLVSNKGSRYAIDFTLDQLEEIIDPKAFFRINRKVILHIKSIERVKDYFNGRLSVVTNLMQGDLCIISRERVNDFKIWLDT
ncbi:MAG: response regulator transcription factor [Bacteroidia bacterium]|jgi:DNA-binding LytR/AlgR family response regulator|nr:response regulator transcription factor [Bacteroidia bacterium]